MFTYNDIFTKHRIAKDVSREVEIAVITVAEIFLQRKTEFSADESIYFYRAISALHLSRARAHIRDVGKYLVSRRWLCLIAANV